MLRNLNAQFFGNQVLGELALHGQHILSCDSQAQSLTMILNDGIQLFYDDQLIHLGCKIKNQLVRQRIGHTEF